MAAYRSISILGGVLGKLSCRLDQARVPGRHGKVRPGRDGHSCLSTTFPVHILWISSDPPPTACNAESHGLASPLDGRHWAPFTHHRAYPCLRMYVYRRTASPPSCQRDDWGPLPEEPGQLAFPPHQRPRMWLGHFCVRQPGAETSPPEFSPRPFCRARVDVAYRYDLLSSPHPPRGTFILYCLD